ncbi:MAG: FKBP-type peptidyl-prolyl cis-trans isomerase [Verrucomicrobia bacterium]|nr:FKBP-type peptidyl-prolyl cis-trans isomerase [Verrucomicrobiota bacterium]
MKLSRFFLYSVVFFSSASATTAADIKQVSEAFGHIIIKHLKRIEVEFDMAQVLKGMQDASVGKEPPMSEDECIQALDAIQEQHLTNQSKENLKLSEAFLEAQAKERDITVLENGKVQYRVLAPGNGPIIESTFAPLVRYVLKKLDGSILAEGEEPVSLNETIPGLKAGMLGMKEGEKRIIYIHPTQGFGDSSAMALLPPNLLLIFEIEAIKADTNQ